MDYIAHKKEDNQTQSIKDHLTNTANLAVSFSVPMMQKLAYAAGIAHDIGKYANTFQQRIRGKNIRFEHAVPGAIEYQSQKTIQTILFCDMISYCIAGHHTGLPDGGTDSDTPDNITLLARLARKANYQNDSDYQTFKKEITLPQPESPELMQIMKQMMIQSNQKHNITDFAETYAFFTRYLFSCLTDADYLDTEHFCRPDIHRQTHADFEKALACVQQERTRLQEHAVTELQKARQRLQLQAISAADSKADIDILNMPTGSGKTLCSLNIALQKIADTQASDHPKKRIIYVIPYTSVIEQTANTFNTLIGEHTDILQHHSNYTYQDEEELTTMQKIKLATENWDIPVIVTTTVQFFESLYHYKSSRLRKMHNMADSIIIFDEIHTLPIHLLQPCLRAVGYITKYLNSEAIFLSATMPDYTDLFQAYMPDATVKELISDKTDFQYFQKCTYQNLGNTSLETIVQQASNCQNSLIIVNKRKTARDVYKMLTGKKFHLSTNMTPDHRQKTMHAIKTALQKKEHITVVSTSLIEVGVDLDFQTVFRELAGLDSILQSGGRCNREGNNTNGNVFIFHTDEKTAADMQKRISITSDLLNRYSDISSDECIKEYYSRLFKLQKKEIETKTLDQMNTFLNPKTGFISIPFRSYANQFSIIAENSTGIVIDNNSDTHTLLAQLANYDFSAKRKLQKYTVSLKPYEWKQATQLGILEDTGFGIWKLSNPNYYNPETGLQLDTTHDVILD